MEIGFIPDWETVFRRDFCKVCENYRICPISYQCHDMIEFIENNEDTKNVRNGNRSEKVRP